MGLSENSVPLNPMVLLIIIPFLNGYNWEYTLFSDKPTWRFCKCVLRPNQGKSHTITSSCREAAAPKCLSPKASAQDILSSLASSLVPNSFFCQNLLLFHSSEDQKVLSDTLLQSKFLSSNLMSQIGVEHLISHLQEILNPFHGWNFLHVLGHLCHGRFLSVAFGLKGLAAQFFTGQHQQTQGTWQKTLDRQV